MADVRAFQIDNAATITVTGNSAAYVRPLDNGSESIQHVVFLVSLGAAPTGTSPTLVYKLQSSLDGTTWFDVASTPTLNTNGQTARLEANANELQWRVVKTVGGTTPSFTLVNSYLVFK